LSSVKVSSSRRASTNVCSASYNSWKQKQKKWNCFETRLLYHQTITNFYFTSKWRLGSNYGRDFGKNKSKKLCKMYSIQQEICPTEITD
jgi:hypothetical protein